MKTSRVLSFFTGKPVPPKHTAATGMTDEQFQAFLNLKQDEFERLTASLRAKSEAPIHRTYRHHGEYFMRLTAEQQQAAQAALFARLKLAQAPQSPMSYTDLTDAVVNPDTAPEWVRKELDRG